ncbi:MAG: glycosyltransferase family 4 protein [Bacteroidales bacterium]|nr:glycosyltransferase family 4 protein [Bacteroidales bacterium]
MKVLIVCNNVYMRGNGVSSAVTSLRSRLIGEGIDVRLLACENPEEGGMQPDYPLPHFVFPIFEPIIKANGYRYPKLPKSVIREAVGWADVVHLMEGFPLQATTVKMAKELNKPCVGTYHIFTENITANLGLSDGTIINKLVNIWWRSSVYNHCASVQCPTETVKRHLEENGYSAPLRVISNGIVLHDIPTDAEEPQTNPYRILCIGRLSNEKSQKTLIKAMRHSAHAHEIALHFAGNGPKAKNIMKAAQRLVKDGVVTHKPVFGFYSAEELRALARTSYLYVHCARTEVEGLSCLEAIQQGTVPVIAQSKLSATHQFALDERSLFPVNDAKALAEKIDWWIEHPAERKAMSKRYAESAKRYDISESTRQIITMYEEALQR